MVPSWLYAVYTMAAEEQPHLHDSTHITFTSDSWCRSLAAEHLSNMNMIQKI